ncbi:MAG: hypothetical protein AAFU38_10480, partial [Bacteroidota bacterium]
EYGHSKLLGLEGVRQIAVDVGSLPVSALNSLSRIPGLSSLVLRGGSLSVEDVESLGAGGAKIELIDR